MEKNTRTPANSAPSKVLKGIGALAGVLFGGSIIFIIFLYIFFLAWSCTGTDPCAKYWMYAMGAPDVRIISEPKIIPKDILIGGEKINLKNSYWTVSGSNAGPALTQFNELYLILKNDDAEEPHVLLSLDLRLGDKGVDIMGVFVKSKEKFFHNTWNKPYCEKGNWDNLDPQSSEYSDIFNIAKPISSVELTSYSQSHGKINLHGSFSVPLIHLWEEENFYENCNEQKIIEVLSLEIPGISLSLDSDVKYRIEGMDGWHEI